jgi:carbon monoxide dehydrogenase subunit G
LKADLDIQVTDLDEGNSISFKAKGKDRQVATTIIVDATLSLQPSDRGTQIMVQGRWNVIGTVATMGSGTIRKKADSIMDEFFSAASEELS